MKEKTLQNEKREGSPGAVKEKEPVSEAQRKERKWRKASDLILAVANNCIHGMNTSAIKIDGIEVMGIWKGRALILTILGFDPPPEADKTP